MAVNKPKDKTPVDNPNDKTDYNRIAIDATVIAGALIFFTISSVGIVIPSNVITHKTQIGLLYKAFTAAVAFVIIVPFSIDALGALRSPPNNRKAMAIGLVVIPLLIGILSLLYLFTSLGWIQNYIPPTNSTSAT
jgi:hypothetical protein